MSENMLGIVKDTRVDSKMEEINFPWDKVGCWRRVDPFTIAFVYPKVGKSFVVKGGMQQVMGFLEPIKQPAIVHKTMFYKGRGRTIINLIGTKKAHLYIWTEADRKSSNYKKKCMYVISGHEGFTKYVRRVPRSWIKELDNFV